MSYRAYPEYKDSGVEWLGEVPAHWRLDRSDTYINSMADTVPAERLSDKEVFHYSIPVVQDTGDGRYEDGGEIESSKLLISQDQVLVSKLNPRKGTVCLATPQDVVTVCSGEFVPLSSKTLYLDFLLYLVRTTNYRFRLESMVESATRSHQRASPSDIAKFRWAFPPEGEQVKIATFLDHETARIDALVEEQQRLIALLKEKRQAVISHAVTKGLDSDVPMKNSGVEWLGEVPEHWEVKKLKHFGKVIGGYAFKSTDFSEAGHPVIKISNVGHLEFDWEDSSFLDDDFYYSHKDFTAPKNSLIFAMTRPIIAGGIKVAKLSMDNNPLINQRVGFMTIKEEGLANFIVLATQSDSFIAQFKNNLTVTNQPNISSEGIESVSVAIPPKQELKTIIQSLEKAMEKFLQLIFFATKNIELLQERRSALISAAVTGKIDVRGWQPPEGADAKETSQKEAV